MPAMTPSQMAAVVQARAVMLRMGVRPENIRVDLIPDEPQKLLTAPSKAYKPAHGGYPGDVRG